MLFEEERNRAKNLYNEKHYSEALDIYEELKKNDFANFMKYCSFNYMWCLYKLKINSKEAFLPENKPETKKHIKFILEHCSNKDLLFQRTVFAVLRYLKGQANFPAETINIWLDKLDPQLLSDEEQTGTLDGKEIAYKSPKEEWYALKSKACEKLEMFSECQRISEEALSVLPKLHHDNHIWFKRRIAIAKHNLGMSGEALEMLLDLMKYKKDWFISSKIIDIYLDLDDYAKALYYSMDAILKPGDENMKVNLFWLAGTIFHRLDMEEEENIMKNFAVKLRLANGWKLSSAQREHYNTVKNQIESLQLGSLRKQVMEVAKEYKWKNKEKRYGTIAKILPNNKAGFIKTEKNSYYFKLNDIQGSKSLAVPGKKVQFYLESAFDHKKKVETENAVYISFLE